ncbi:MAG: triple tyrosine motif-containing protein [Ferruginibacter sp.]
MKHTISFIFLLMLSLPAISQKKEIVVVRKYTQKDGLSSYNIRKVIKDKWGFMWVATQDGLSKFDGRSFTNYTKNAKPKQQICGTDVRELIEDTAQNLIWVLPGEFGINAINTITGEVITTIQIPHVTNDDWNISMLKTGNFLWIGTSTGVRIYNILNNKFDNTLALPENHKNSVDLAVRSILLDENGNVWVCYDRYGIVIYNPITKAVIKEIKLTSLNDHRKSNEIRFIRYTCLKGKIILATTQGLRKISYSKNYDIDIDNFPCTSLPVLNTENIDYIALNKQGDILLSGFNKLFKFDQALRYYTVLQEPARTSETDWLNAVACIYNDNDDNTWLGCQEGLAFISKLQSPFTPFNYDKITNIKLDHVRSICPLPNGDILAGLINGVVQIDHTTNKYTKYDTGHLYYHIYQDKKGYVHVSRREGMFIFNNGKIIPIEKIYPEFSLYSSIPVNSHLFINDSLVILGSENNNGILVWNPEKKTVRKITEGTGPVSLSSSIVNNIFRDARNRIWVLSDNVISILSEDLKRETSLFLTDSNSKAPYKLFFDMCESKGCYWIMSYGSGVLQLDSTYKIKNVIGVKNGLSNEGVYQVYDLSGKDLLVTSNNGLSLIDLNTFKCRNYFAEDGLHSNGFEEVCGMKNDEAVFAGGVNGFTIIDPSKFTTNKTPPVFYFKNIRLELENKIIDTSDLKEELIKIPSNWLQVNISFTGLNYLNPDRVIYQYRIKELNKSWINLGTQNFISLIGLSPGSYTLEVKASNEDGYWSEAKKLTLVFEPKWYQTLWFRLLVLVTIAGLFYAFYRYRISQVKQQHLIRKNIASDLHDDIGSTLNTVKVFTHLAKKDNGKSGYLDEIENALTEATIGLRDMIWVLDDSQDSISEFLERIKKFALPVTTANGLQFQCKSETEESFQLLSKTEKRNLLLMSKEVINNSIKYAECKNIDVVFKARKDLKILMISDDGKGFLTGEVSKGNGLKNLLHRAEQIGYLVEIISSPGNGTSVRIRKK